MLTVVVAVRTLSLIAVRLVTNLLVYSKIPIKEYNLLKKGEYLFMKKITGFLLCVVMIMSITVSAFAGEITFVSPTDLSQCLSENVDGVATPAAPTKESRINSNGSFTFDFSSYYMDSYDDLKPTSSSVTITAKATATGSKTYYILLYDVSTGSGTKVSYTADGTNYSYTFSVDTSKTYRIQLSQGILGAGKDNFSGSGTISNVKVN